MQNEGLIACAIGFGQDSVTRRAVDSTTYWYISAKASPGTTPRGNSDTSYSGPLLSRLWEAEVHTAGACASHRNERMRMWYPRGGRTSVISNLTRPTASPSAMAR